MEINNTFAINLAANPIIRPFGTFCSSSYDQSVCFGRQSQFTSSGYFSCSTEQLYSPELLRECFSHISEQICFIAFLNNYDFSHIYKFFFSISEQIFFPEQNGVCPPFVSPNLSAWTLKYVQLCPILHHLMFYNCFPAPFGVDINDLYFVCYVLFSKFQ